MPSRYLQDSITTSRSLAQLSDAAERLFIRLMVCADDFGLFDADPRCVKGNALPLLDHLTERKVPALLAELTVAGLLVVYQAGDRTVGWLRTFTDHNRPRAKRPKLPLHPDHPFAGRASAVIVSAATVDDAPRKPNENRVLANANKCPQMPPNTNTITNTITTKAASAAPPWAVAAAGTFAAALIAAGALKRAPSVADLKKWADALDKLVRLDGYALDDVRKLLEWIPTDKVDVASGWDGWWDKARSPLALRVPSKGDGVRKIEKLFAAMKRGARWQAAKGSPEETRRRLDATKGESWG